LVSESEEPGVVEELVGNLDFLACFADVIDGTVMIFSAVLEGDVCVFWSALDDLVAWLSAQRGRRMRSRPLCWSKFAIFGTRGMGPCRQI
jgi:hypothetical protein